MELALLICLGLGLSAACGFRVFVPLLGLSMAAMGGHVQLSEGFDWIGTWPAVACLGTATALEIGAYYIPWLDNLLDTIATPAAVVAGTMATASVVTDMSPLMKWSLALIAGGGVAGLVQTGTVVARGSSTLATGGMANFTVSTTELIGSVAATVMALVVPVLTALLVAIMAAWIVTRWAKRRQSALPNADG